jgi:hypothetical protein
VRLSKAQWMRLQQFGMSEGGAYKALGLMQRIYGKQGTATAVAPSFYDLTTSTSDAGS